MKNENETQAQPNAETETEIETSLNIGGIVINTFSGEIEEEVIKMLELTA